MNNEYENNLRITDEIANLPSHYHDTFSHNFLALLATLRLHGFFIVRADEAQETVGKDADLWAELSHPSVWLHSRSVAPLKQKLQAAELGTAEHTKVSNDLIHANLEEQRRLLSLLDEFYNNRSAASLYAQLIVETIDLGESYLRTQGSSIRLLMDSTTQRAWLQESQKEMDAFAHFLATTAPSHDA